MASVSFQLARLVLLECPALADVREEFFPFVTDSSDAMAIVVCARTPAHGQQVHDGMPCYNVMLMTSRCYSIHSARCLASYSYSLAGECQG